MHELMKAVLAPGPAAAKLFATLFPYPGAWSGMTIMELLAACPPYAAHRGADGEALWPASLTRGVDAEFMACYSATAVGGPGAPPGPAAFAYTSLASARRMINHVHGTAIYGRDPALGDSEAEADELEDAALEAHNNNADQGIGRKRRWT